MCADAQIRGDPDLPTAEQSQLAAATLRMLAEPTRLRILWALFSGEQSVGRLAELVGVAPSVVSHDHARRLTEEALFHADHVVADLPDHAEM
jgi:DNA-binding transcriptional ArsR family regulator